MKVYITHWRVAPTEILSMMPNSADMRNPPDEVVENIKKLEEFVTKISDVDFDFTVIDKDKIADDVGFDNSRSALRFENDDVFIDEIDVCDISDKSWNIGVGLKRYKIDKSEKIKFSKDTPRKTIKRKLMQCNFVGTVMSESDSIEIALLPFWYEFDLESAKATIRKHFEKSDQIINTLNFDNWTDASILELVYDY